MENSRLKSGKIFANALLLDGKLLFWKTSPNQKQQAGDYYKDFILSGFDYNTNIGKLKAVSIKFEYFYETEEEASKENNFIFDFLATKFYERYPLVENYNGRTPY